MDKSSSATGGIGFAGAFFLVLLVLKITGHLSWSWWWVTAPVWIPAAFAVLTIAGALLVMLLRRTPTGKARRQARQRLRSQARAARVRRAHDELLERNSGGAFVDPDTPPQPPSDPTRKTWSVFRSRSGRGIF